MICDLFEYTLFLNTLEPKIPNENPPFAGAGSLGVLLYLSAPAKHFKYCSLVSIK